MHTAPYVDRRRWPSGRHPPTGRGALGQQPLPRELDHIAAAARAVISCDQAGTQEERECEHAADLDLVLVRAEVGEQRAHVFHPPAVDAAEAFGHRLVTPGPVAYREVDAADCACPGGGGQGEQSPQLRSRITTLALAAPDRFVD